MLGTPLDWLAGKLHGKASFKTLKEVSTSLIHSTIEFCAEIYLRVPKNQSLVQKKLNSAMRLLLNEDYDASCAQMMTLLGWLNVRNMWHWCTVRTLNRIMNYPPQAPHLWDLLRQNEDPERPLRYNGLKMTRTKNTRWALESFAYCAVDVWNGLKLHGMFSPTMRNTVKMLLRNKFNNENIN